MTDAATLARRIDLAYLTVSGTGVPACDPGGASASPAIDPGGAGASPAIRRRDAAATGPTGVAGLRTAVEQARTGGFRSLCVMPVLAGTVKKHAPGLRVSAVVSYPLGQDTLAAKVFACQELLEQGVEELDVVLDLFALANDNRAKLEQEARALLRTARSAGALLKCIIEAPILSETQIRAACEVLVAAGVDCIKTSTGYQRPPTTPAMVRLIREVAGERCRVKASGGIRTLADAQALLNAGADIIGTSSGAAILAEAGARKPGG